MLKDIKSWIKDTAPNFSMLIRQDRLGFWRKPKHLNYSYQTLSTLLESEDTINVDKCLSSLNSIIEKHNSFLMS